MIRYAPSTQSLLSCFAYMRASRSLFVGAIAAGALCLALTALHLPSRLNRHLRALIATSKGQGLGLPAATPDTSTLPPVRRDGKVVQEIYAGGLKNDWQDWGWADRSTNGPGPAKLDFSKYAGWILHHDVLDNSFGSLVFRVKAPKKFGDFLEVKLLSDDNAFDPIIIGTRYQFTDADGWLLIVVPLYELNPYSQSFNGLRIRAHRQVAKDQVLLDRIALTAPLKDAIPAREFPSREGVVTIRCSANATPISSLIYGVAGTAAAEDMRATAYRFGGNPTSRFNWTLGNVWNTAADWYYRNVKVNSWQNLFDLASERNAPLTVTLPMIGWVSRDSTSYSFPVSVYGPQKEVDPDHSDIGNGLDSNGKEISPGDPKRTSIAAPPELVGQWVAKLQAESSKRGRPVHSYILDNEPCLWNSTHRDVHPEPLGYDELLERTVKYGSAIRNADPQAVIAGPAEWGWSNYFWSAKDAKAGFSQKPDRRAHGDVPLLDWYLQELNKHEKKTGVHILDVVDLHFYPQGKGIWNSGATSPEITQRRIRATRGLWDPTYLDESWIDEKIQLIPRLKEIIARNYPGRRISIGEWNFGGEGHISGGLATAEALGRYAESGIYSAYYWTAPKKGTPAYWAFRAFRNFDGKGGTFLDNFLPSSAPEGVSVFASRSTNGTHVVAVVLVLSSSHAYQLDFDVATCGVVNSWTTFAYGGKPDGFVSSKQGSTGKIADKLAPYSIAVLDIETAPKHK
jgi:hypothetical protein